MKRSKRCRVLTWLVIGTAIALIGIALSAGYLGADSDEKWGPFRIGILVVGLVILAVFGGLRVVNVIDRWLLSKQWSNWFLARQADAARFLPARFRPNLQSHDVLKGEMSRRLPANDHGRFKDETTHRFCAALRSILTFLGKARRWIAIPLFFVLVEILYIWFVSVGYWTTWPDTTNYYDMLADAFAHGQTTLLIDPPPALAELDNPYPTAERPGIAVLPDVSYFRGKYYMYWGPAPALVATLWKLATMRTVGDQYIAFIAVSAIFFFSLRIILYLKRKYFPSLPGWLLASSMVIVATSHPMLWVLNHPAIHSAAIASGQAFLLAGLYFALPVIDGSQSQPWRLFLAGALWSLALSSRLILVGSIAVLSVATGISLLSRERGRRQWKAAVISIATFGLPIALIIGFLGLYNYVRFGSVLETGLRYQLSVIDLNQLIKDGQLFNLAYLPPNLIYYLFAPVRLRTIFPFVRPIFGELPQISMFFKRFNIPSTYHIENASSLLFAMPTIVFSLFLIEELLCGRAVNTPRGKEVAKRFSRLERDPKLCLILGVLLLAGLLAGIPAFFYFWVANRFLLDAVPLLILIAVLGSWLLYSSSRPYPLRRNLAVLLILTIVIAATLISLLLAITGANTRFDDLNPALFETMKALFSW